MIGQRIAHYSITAHLGSGGMGHVYQSTDTRLGRGVALKFLPEAVAHDPERASRFEREAKTLASLNHPNIAALHGLEEFDGRGFLVMELVPGQTCTSGSMAWRCRWTRRCQSQVRSLTRSKRHMGKGSSTAISNPPT